MSEGTFVCFEITKSLPIHRIFKGTHDREQHVSYINLKFFFHGPYKKGSNKAYIIATDFMSMKNHGINTLNWELYNFLSSWTGAELDVDEFVKLSYKDIREECIGLNAEVTHEAQQIVERGEAQKKSKKHTVIKKISPSVGTIRINLSITIPEHLQEKQQRRAGFAIKQQKPVLTVVEEKCA